MEGGTVAIFYKITLSYFHLFLETFITMRKIKIEQKYKISKLPESLWLRDLI